MKIKYFFTLSLFAILVLTACNKNTNEQPAKSDSSNKEIEANIDKKETKPKETTQASTDPLDKLTYLTSIMSLYESSSDACIQISRLADEDSYSSDPSVLDTQEFRTKIAVVLKNDQSVDALLSDLKSRILPENKITMVDAVCLKDGVIYITLLQYGEDNSQNVFVATWSESDQKFSLLPPLSGLMDFYYVFAPAALDGKHLFKSGYGDAGHYSWKFHLMDPQKQSYEQVENCNGGYVYSETTGEFTDEFEFDCESQYKP